MPTADGHPSRGFSDDSPKENPWEEDTLGFLPFSQRLAQAVIDMEAPRGYVIGIQGAWGSGKSTALNFVKAFLSKHNEELGETGRPVLVVDFMPWMISGHPDLVGTFFKVLSEAIVDPAASKNRWRKSFGRGLEAGTDSVVDAAAKVALIAAAAHPILALALPAASSLAKKTLKGASAVLLAEPSLQAAYEVLRSRLSDGDHAICVMIDDIDRLAEDEIRTLFRMVKTVGRLPGVTYVLCYDRRIVSTAFAVGDGDAGDQPNFAEKIIQHEVELPRPDKSSILAMLDAEIAFLEEVSPPTERWHDLVRSGLEYWVRFPRDVHRLGNAVRFSWSALKGEIDPGDLLCMEALRLFDSRTFEWIRDSRRFLFQEELFQFANDEHRDLYVNSFLETLPTFKRERMATVLKALFPSRAKAFSGAKAFTYAETFQSTTIRRGVGSKAGYDSYFSLFPARFSIPRQLIEQTLADIGSEDLLFEHTRNAYARKDRRGRSLIAEYYEELALRITGESAVAPTLALLKAIMRSADFLSEEDWLGGFLLFSAGTSFESFLKSILESMGSKRAGDCLRFAVDDIASAHVWATVWVKLARELGVIPTEGASANCPISMEDFKALEKPLLRRIEDAHTSGTLDQAPFYFDVARAWYHIAGPDPVRSWIGQGIDRNPKFLAKLSIGLLQRSFNSSRQSYQYRGGDEPPYLDVVEVKQACDKHADSELLDDDERARVKALQRGLWGGQDGKKSSCGILVRDNE